jgi:putative DNA primase/helicase
MKLWLATNFKPKISGTDPAMWRRIHLIPFTVTIPPEKRDGALPEKLKMEAPGVLAWAVQGCLDWQAKGLNPPAVVTEATRAYKAEMDEVGQFLSDCVQCPVKGTVTKAEMFEAYQRWSRDNGSEEISVGGFGSRLKAHGVEERKSGSSRLWKNVKLVQPTWDNEDEIAEPSWAQSLQQDEAQDLTF